MQNPKPVPTSSTTQGDLAAAAKLISGVTAVSVLYFARDVLIPVCLAILISFVLAPLAQLVRRRGVPQPVAVISVVVLTFGGILGVGALGASQLSQLTDNLPQYQENIRNKIRIFKVSTSGSSAVARATNVIEDLGKEFSARKPSTDSSPGLKPIDGTPVPVEIRTPSANPLKFATDFLSPILNPLASTGLVLLLVIFFLLQQQDLRDRVIRLLGTKTLHRTTEAMDEAATRLSRYFLLQTALNVAFGIAVGFGLWFIGIPSPLLWGSFAMLMRFVPYIGSVLAAVLPVALAAAVDPGWTMMAWTVALFAIGEPLMGHAIEPAVFGHQTGLSPVAIVTSATFWTWLWGPIGLIVATPLTLCLVILGQYTKRLEFLHVLLGDQPALTPPESFYQRLIAGDPAELIEQAERQLKDMDLPKYLDDVALKGLVLAQRDVTSGELSSDRQELMIDGVRDLVDGLPVEDVLATVKNGLAANGENDTGVGSRRTAPPNVLCISGRGAVDQAAAVLLVHLLDRAGVAAQIGPDGGIRQLDLVPAAKQAIAIVCISYVGLARTSHVRFVTRRLRREFPAAKIVIGGWGVPTSDAEWQQIREDLPTALFATTLQDAVGHCLANVGDLASEQLSHPTDTASTERPAAVLPVGSTRLAFSSRER
jgi:predicted PurR-regulated permease PerM